MRLFDHVRGTAVLAAAVLAGCATPMPPAAPSTAAPLAARAAAAATGPVKVKILAINDFHGNLKPPGGGIRIRDPQDAARTATVAAGGAEHLATAVAQLKAQNPNHIFVAAGDLIGATPLLSALFHDEPAVEALGLVGLDVSAVGNHEFDKGAAELLRLQRGGCHPQEGCKGPAPFKGAAYQYLAASTVVVQTGQTLLPAYHIKTFQGVPMAFIGLTLKGTPGIVMASGIAGLRFDDEAATVNRLVPRLRAQGIEAIAVLIHEGGVPTGDYNECPGISGPIVDIVNKLDPAVDLVVTGHTHRAYNCRIGGRLVTSGDKYGTIVTDIDVVLDPATRDVVSANANNVIVRVDTFARDPRLTAHIAQYERLAQPLLRRVVGRVSAPLPRDNNPAGESLLGQVIADAQLAATRSAGAQVAFMNPGGIRAALQMPADGLVRFEDVFSIQPFNNSLVTLTLTGAQLQDLLEQQWTERSDGGRVLLVSRGFTYTWDGARPPGQRIVPGSVMLDGKAVWPGDTLRITVNSFLADGGDNFPVLRQGANKVTGMLDVDALEQHLTANPVLAPGRLDRIKRVN